MEGRYVGLGFKPKDCPAACVSLVVLMAVPQQVGCQARALRLKSGVQTMVHPQARQCQLGLWWDLWWGLLSLCLQRWGM